MSVKRQPLQWKCRDDAIPLGDATVIMGILNVTPDSFSDGGMYRFTSDAIAHALEMERDGALIIDIGGESTRPGASDVSVEEEISRILPVVEALASQSDCIMSIDTTKAAVAEAALNAGCHIINDVSAGTMDPDMIKTAETYKAGLILMHMQGTPRTMQCHPVYKNVVEDVVGFLKDRIDHCLSAGIAKEAIAVDPGIGFGKTVDHNLELLTGLDQLALLGSPVVVGASRKSFLGTLTDRDVTGRLAGSLAALSYAISRGAHILRVHDVNESCDMVTIMDKLLVQEFKLCQQ